jgi:hypothetical protein
MAPSPLLPSLPLLAVSAVWRGGGGGGPTAAPERSIERANERNAEGESERAGETGTHTQARELIQRKHIRGDGSQKEAQTVTRTAQWTKPSAFDERTHAQTKTKRNETSERESERVRTNEQEKPQVIIEKRRI